MIRKRIKNIEFRECTYLCDPPEIKSWELCYYYPNPDYGNEHLYEKDGDFYVTVYNGVSFRRHKSCFKYRESCYTLGIFKYSDDSWSFEFICDRPLELSKEEREVFWELLEYGYNKLNNNSNR